MLPSDTSPALLQTEIEAFTNLLREQGIHAALAYLNSRTPHRYTGIYRFSAQELHNEALFDRYQPESRQVGAVPLSATFCSLVGQQLTPLEITDAATDEHVRGQVDTPVMSYCGVLIRDGQGQPFGTLCHYDMQRCQERTTDMPLLTAAATQFYQYLHAAG